MTSNRSLLRRSRRDSERPTVLLDLEQLEDRTVPSVVTVDASQAIRTATSQVLGANVAWWDTSLNTAQTQQMVQAAGLNFFRFPGGSSSDTWHFNVGPTYSGEGTTPSMASFIASVNGTGMVTVNYGTGSPQEGAALLAYLNGNVGDPTQIGVGLQWSSASNSWVSVNWGTAGYWAGLRASTPLAQDDGLNFLRIGRTAPFGIQYFEIGNEVYGNWETDEHATPHDPATYVTFAKQFAALAAQIDPNISIGVDGSGTGGSYSQIPGNWTTQVLQQCAQQGFLPGFISDHNYMFDPGNENDANLLLDSATNPNATGYGGPINWAGRAQAYRSLINEYLGAAGANVQLLATEFNSVSSNPSNQTTSLVNGLWLADALGGLLETEYNGAIFWDLRNGYDTSYYNPNLYGWRTGGDYGILGSSNGSPPATGTYVPYPTYFAEQLVSQMVHTGDTVVQASSDDSTLSAYAVLEQNGHLDLLVINKNPSTDLTEQINIAGFTPSGQAVVWQYGKTQDTAQSQTTDGHSSLANWTQTLTVSGSSFNYFFPQYSMTVLDLAPAYVVTSTADTNTPGTLRYGIDQANAGRYSEIDFDISGTGPQTINLASALPAITANGVFINGQSENQFQGVTSTSPLIALNGAVAGSNSDGLLLQGSNCMVSGLLIENFSKNGIEVEGPNNTIGGSTSGARNVISANTNDGVLIDSGISGVVVQGNYIGTNTIGSAVLGNSVGIEVAGNNNTLGASYAVAPNVISGNSSDGVLLDSGSNGNLVLGNYIGTNPGGTVALANNVGIDDAGSSNTIGGSVMGSRNIISGNTGDGVLLDSGEKSGTIQGNYIGVNLGGNTALANSGNGVEVKGTGNAIGGDSASNVFVRNYISGNGNDGVLLGSSASGNRALGNFIGIGVSGTNGIGNAGNAIEIASNSNTIGGTVSGYRNVISGSGNDGVLIDSTGTSNLIEGNFVGTDYAGKIALANSGSGIELQGTGNAVGGTASGDGNLISGNSKGGVRIDSGANGTSVLGNSIGLNLSSAALANGGDGINITSNSNTIGGTATAARNIISGSSSDGVLIASGASGNQVLGNYLGTNVVGTSAVGNSIGIEVAGNSNTVGGSASGASNLISGNRGDGVKLDSGGSGNLVEGDAIGVNTYASATLGNSGNGIEVAGNNNTLGASYAVAPNLISGNSGDGVKIDSGASGNQVLGSYIGTNSGGTASMANKVGVEDGGSSNTIGGSVLGSRNVISNNSGDGVLLDSTANSGTIQGNYIGVNLSGNTALTNSGNGVEIQGTGNLIGGNSGTNVYTRNYISGNSKNGVLLDSGASGNQVLGNFIGVDVTGTNGVGNLVNGIEIASNSNTIGGTTRGLGNVISGNTNDGVLIDSTGGGNLLQGNYVGTDYTGRYRLSNSGSGTEIQGAGNTVGAGNLISGNGKDGVRIGSGANGTSVLGNTIGLNLSSAALANGGNGLNIASSSNTIGGTVAAARNIISGNSGDGVLIASGASANLVLGNYLGTNVVGTSAVGNSIGIEVAGNSNTIGGSASGARNLISGNSNDGVKIDSGASGNLVEGDAIGVNTYVSATLGNSGNGIEVAGNNNTLGASYAVAPNVISGNSGDGVLLDSSSSGNQVLGSYIGTNNVGTASMANKVGVEDGGSSNTIGGSALGSRNIISGNTGDGVLLDSTANSGSIQGNYIGVNLSGNTALANSGNGVEAKGTGNTIGGSSTYLDRNYISGNSNDGVLFDNGASGNQVQGNFIGVGVSGTNGVGNVVNGIEIASNGNTIGGASSGYRNVISGSGNDGVLIDSTGASNVIEGNDVGTDYTGTSAGANSGNGIENAGNYNTVGGSVSGAGNIIAHNSKNGVLVSAGSGDTISQNSIFANTGLGISLASGANNSIAAPTISSATLSGGTLTVTGGFTAATANVSYVLEFFANPSGDAEGKIYLGSLTVTPTSTGTNTFTFTTTTSVTGTDPIITATLTDGAEDTSAFSSGTTVS
jgi:hypothetical protein